jgi:hypothetical protein
MIRGLLRKDTKTTSNQRPQAILAAKTQDVSVYDVMTYFLNKPGVVGAKWTGQEVL